ncbi:MAG: DUF2878 domain-containing protein [Leucothrix sp.]
MPLFKILNFGLFQAGWFVAALLKDQSLWVMLGLVVLHVAISPSKRSDARLLLFLLPIGLTLELLMIVLGLVDFNSNLMLPIWMILLWCLLILSFNHSLQWFQNIPLVFQVVLSGVAGLASYLAAQKFQALSIGEPKLWCSLGIALVWAAQLPVMMMITKYINAKERSCVNN